LNASKPEASPKNRCPNKQQQHGVYFIDLLLYCSSARPTQKNGATQRARAGSTTQQRLAIFLSLFTEGERHGAHASHIVVASTQKENKQNNHTQKQNKKKTTQARPCTFIHTPIYIYIYLSAHTHHTIHTHTSGVMMMTSHHHIALQKHTTKKQIESPSATTPTVSATLAQSKSHNHERHYKTNKSGVCVLCGALCVSVSLWGCCFLFIVCVLGCCVFSGMIYIQKYFGGRIHFSV